MYMYMCVHIYIYIYNVYIAPPGVQIASSLAVAAAQPEVALGFGILHDLGLDIRRKAESIMWCDCCQSIVSSGDCV